MDVRQESPYIFKGKNYSKMELKFNEILERKLLQLNKAKEELENISIIGGLSHQDKMKVVNNNSFLKIPTLKFKQKDLKGESSTSIKSIYPYNFTQKSHKQIIKTDHRPKNIETKVLRIKESEVELTSSSMFITGILENTNQVKMNTKLDTRISSNKSIPFLSNRGKEENCWVGTKSLFSLKKNVNEEMSILLKPSSSNNNLKENMKFSSYLKYDRKNNQKFISHTSRINESSSLINSFLMDSERKAKSIEIKINRGNKIIENNLNTSVKNLKELRRNIKERILDKKMITGIMKENPSEIIQRQNDKKLMNQFERVNRVSNETAFCHRNNIVKHFNFDYKKEKDILIKFDNKIEIEVDIVNRIKKNNFKIIRIANDNKMIRKNVYATVAKIKGNTLKQSKSVSIL
jgi:hypothetical protein